MSDESEEFEIGRGGELQRKHGWFAERRELPTIQPDAVPEGLRDLIPLAARWGISCDVTRHDAGARATPADLAELSRQLAGRHPEVHDFLYLQDEAEDPEVSKAVSAFQCLLVFELEEARGPGIPGILDWALRYYREHPGDAAARRHLQRAYEHMRALGGSWNAEALATAKSVLDPGNG